MNSERGVDDATSFVPVPAGRLKAQLAGIHQRGLFLGIILLIRLFSKKRKNVETCVLCCSCDRIGNMQNHSRVVNLQCVMTLELL